MEPVSDIWLLSVDRYGSGLIALLEPYLSKLDESFYRELPAGFSNHRQSQASGTPVTPPLWSAGVFTLGIAGALDIDPDEAMGLATASALWSFGAELLDDLMDSDPSIGESERSVTMLIGAAAVGPIPTRVLLQLPNASAETRLLLVQHLTDQTMEAARGQQDDVDSIASGRTPAEVLQRYVLKTGSVYRRNVQFVLDLKNRDRLHIDDENRWKQFAVNLGVLFQTRNDQVDLASKQQDIQNGTHTFRMACAHAAAPSSERAKLSALQQQARSDERAAAELVELLQSDSTQALYSKSITKIYLESKSLLEQSGMQTAYHRALMVDLELATQISLEDPSALR